jgi:ATP-dependent Clp protease protease subunit
MIGWDGSSGGVGDLRAQLLARRIVLLRGALDDALAGQVAAELLLLEAEGGDPIVLHVDSAGGPVQPAFTLIDTIDLLRVPLEAVCVGRAEGTAAVLVAAAPRRWVAPHARFLLVAPRVSAEGRAVEMEALSAEHTAQLAQLTERLARSTGRPVEHLEADLAAGRWLTAEQAVAYGLVDGIWRSKPVPGAGH